MGYRLFTLVVTLILLSVAAGLCFLAITDPEFFSDYFRDTLLLPDWGMDD